MKNNTSSSVTTIEKRHGRKKKQFSPAGNRTPVSRVTGGDTHYYTPEDFRDDVVQNALLLWYAGFHLSVENNEMRDNDSISFFVATKDVSPVGSVGRASDF